MLVHFASQAASALGPRTNLRWHETRIWALSASICWLLGLAYAARAALRAPAASVANDARQRALTAAERAAAGITLLFAIGHGLGFARQVLAGELLPGDLRPALIATLSSTSSGVPLVAAAYLCAVGSTAFLVARAAQRALEADSKLVLGAPLLLGLCACALGVYAVLEFATGSLAPW